VLEPLEALGDEEGLEILLDRLAWDGDALGLGDPALLRPGVANFVSSLERLIEVLDQDEITLEEFGKAIAPIALGIAQIVAAIADAERPATAPADAATRFAEDLLGFLLEHYLARRLPRLLLVLRLLGLMKPIDVPALTSTAGAVVRAQQTGLRVDLTAVGESISDPLEYARKRFVLDDAGARRTALAISDLLGPELADGLIAAGLAASYGQVADQPGLTLTPAERDAAEHMLIVDGSVAGGPGGTRAAMRLLLGLTDDTPGTEGLGFLVAASGSVGVAIQRPGGTFTANLGGALQPLLITVHAVRLLDDAGSPQLQLDLAYQSTPSATEPFVRFGAVGSTRFELGTLAASGSLVLDDDGVDVGGTVDLTGILLAIQGGDGDGFLNKILPANPIELRADLGADASLRKGVQIRGSGVLEYRFRVGKSIGPLELQEIQMALGLASTGAKLDLSATIGISIGPVRGVVEAIGMRAALRPPPPEAPGGAGNAGPLAFALGFKPPSGAGFSVKAGPVTGGGYLFFDPDNEQYAGILQLAIQVVNVTVIGLLTTKLPDPAGPPGATKKGFSLILIIAVEFPPIQLGYGFALVGIGGLLGIHRTMMVEPLRNGVRDGSVNSILFPQDPIARAPQIISQLRTIFPPAEGRFVFGPMVKIGWGPNAIIELSAAVVLELMAPIRLVILGRIQIALPDKKDPVLNLRLDIVGVLDFDKGEVSIDASLVDSRLVVFVITGDMAVRVGWGASKMFAVAAGGFHPKFEPPPGFPALRRLGIALSDSDNPRLRMETYMALTSNTIQFGAGVDAYVSVDAFVGTFSAAANITFDALIQFQPFELIAELAASVDIELNGDPLLHAAFRATLSGPQPWHAIGYAEFNFLGKRRVDFEVTSGTPKEPPVLELRPVEVLTELVKAFVSDDAWATLPPAEADRVVSIADRQPGDGIPVHPLGSISARQRIVPLKQTIDRFGTSVVKPTAFTLKGFEVEGAPGVVPPESELYDDFSPGQFLSLTDDERVARPAFESMRSGGSVKATRFRVPADRPGGVAAQSGYEEAIVDVEPATGARDATDIKGKAAELPAEALAALVQTGAAAHAETRSNGPRGFRGPAMAVGVAGERWVVADADTLMPVAGAPSESAAEAHERLDDRAASAAPAVVVAVGEGS
jgi:hypothetical protein